MTDTSDQKEQRDQHIHIGSAIVNILDERGSTTKAGLMNLAVGRASRTLDGESVELRQYHETLDVLLKSGQIVPQEINFQSGNEPGYSLNLDYVPLG
jgi:hypothetical protein